jgi:hypothetical protein
MAQEERESRFQFHNKAHEVVLKDGTRIVGIISRIDPDKREFYLLEPNRPGMLGGRTAGQRFSWEECRSVRAESSGNVEGVYDDDMIPQWERWSRASGAR